MSSRKLMVSMPALLHRMSTSPSAAVTTPKACVVQSLCPLSAANYDTLKHAIAGQRDNHSYSA
jgi:hypothetical protein